MPNVWDDIGEDPGFGDPKFLKKRCCKEKGVDKLFKLLSKSGQKQVHFTSNDRREKNVTAEVFFKESKGSFQSVFGSDRKYWSAEMKEALGLGDSGVFLINCGHLVQKFLCPSLRYLSMAKRQA